MRQIRRRLADENRDGVLELRARDLEVGRLNPRGVELGLRLRDVDTRRDALVVPRRGELHGTFVGRHRRFEQRDLRIEPAQLEVVHRQLGLAAEERRLHVGARRLRAGDARLDIAPHAAPEIGLVREVDRQLVVRRSCRRRPARSLVVDDARDLVAEAPAVTVGKRSARALRIAARAARNCASACATV